MDKSERVRREIFFDGNLPLDGNQENDFKINGKRISFKLATVFSSSLVQQQRTS